MSSAPSHAPSSAPSASAEPVVEIPKIADVRKGFFRWIWGTISGTARGLKNAALAVTWRPTKYVFRKVWNTAIWTPNYLYHQSNIFFGDKEQHLQGTRLWNGIKFAFDPENYRLYGGGGHGHGGGEGGGH